MSSEETTQFRSNAARQLVIERHRKTWLSFRQLHPTAGRGDLYHAIGATYAYLCKYDRNWFEEHSPVSRIHTAQRQRVDWEARDADLLRKLAHAVASLLGGQERRSVSPCLQFNVRQPRKQVLTSITRGACPVARNTSSGRGK